MRDSMKCSDSEDGMIAERQSSTSFAGGWSLECIEMSKPVIVVIVRHSCTQLREASVRKTTKMRESIADI